MNNYEDWARLVAKRLKGEADLITAIEKNELDGAAAREAFVRVVLKPFLPENFGVGSGRIIDAFGNQSEHMDIVVYDRSFPRIAMPGTGDTYLYESVLAAFSVSAKYIRKTFFDSLDACASLAQLKTNINKATLVKLAKKNGLKPTPNMKFVHEDPLRTARFELIGRPPAFAFGFSGFRQSYRQLQENVELWLNSRREKGIETPMQALPAVIASQGCFAWRNAAPLTLSNRELLGIGNDYAPVRLIVLQLLYLINRRLNAVSDAYGLKPNLNVYLNQFQPPNFEIGVGKVSELVGLEKKIESAATEQATISARYIPAKDHSPLARPTIKQLQEAVAPEKLAQPEDQGDAFNKFSSAPIPGLDDSSPESVAEPPEFESTLVEGPAENATESAPAALISPKPPIDIDLGSTDDGRQENSVESEGDEYVDTAQIPPNTTASSNEEGISSTDDFFARAKRQLTTPAQPSADEKDSPSTTPV